MANTADGETLANRWFRYGKLWVPVLGLTALAGALRLIGLGDVPPGLYHDEAYNGLDALSVLEGSFQIYFRANHGREPLFLYLIALTVGILGRTPAAVRLAAAICGTLTVPLTYLMVRTWFNHRTALLSAFIISITLWHIHLSRVAFRAVMLPLAIAASLWWAGRAFNTGQKRAWLLTGILYGVTYYTYLAVRFTPIALLGFVIYLLIAGHGDRLWPGSIYFAVGTLIPLVPLGTYTMFHWDVVMGRTGQVSLLNHAVNQGDLWGTLGRHLIRTLGMFFVEGDSIPRHNVPGRPVFLPFLGAAMVVGSARAAVEAKRRNAGAALALIWVGAMLVPTVAAADAPHFLRAVGVLPLLAVLPALGLDAVWKAANRRGLRMWGPLLICFLLAASLGITVRDYFFDYASSSEAAYAFESAATELAGRINRFTGIGWDGQSAVASDRHLSGERRAYVDMRLWRSWKALSFLVPEQQAVIQFEPNKLPVIPPVDRTMLLLWPYDDLGNYLAALPSPVRIVPEAGPLTRGDLEEKSYPAYASYVVEPMRDAPSPALAHFGEAIALADFAVDKEGETWDVRLMWRAQKQPEADYTAFVFLCNDRCAAGDVIAQDDAPPGGLYYPTRLWRPGDVVIDVHSLEPPHGEGIQSRIAVGLYEWPTMERLPVTKASAPSHDDMFFLPTSQ